MAPLSKGFYSHWTLLSLCTLVTARASKPMIWWIKSSAWNIYFSQPLIYIRLSTYPNQLRYGSKLSLDCSGFARHYSQNRWLLSIPRPTKMFQFGHLSLSTLYIQVKVRRHYSPWVSPFGHPRFKVCWQLPKAYRSLLRPSSITYVKASVICAYVAFYEYLQKLKVFVIYAFFN